MQNIFLIFSKDHFVAASKILFGVPKSGVKNIHIYGLSDVVWQLLFENVWLCISINVLITN
jgi:hypothetical protein